MNELKVTKLGQVKTTFEKPNQWVSHFMAPAPVKLSDDKVRVYVGGWDQNKISRIWFVDVPAKNPTEVLEFSANPVLNIGRDGCFDENGVFPAHVYRHDRGEVYLYYTGFQLGHKIRHYNFGGLATASNVQSEFKRYSEAPVLDRADEGLYVRAGQSLEVDKGEYHCVYSAGSGWHFCENEYRPVYNVFYQKSKDGINLEKRGREIVTCDLEIEHGLGRPQIIKLGKYFYVFYTRRIIKDMKYFMGCSRSADLEKWERCDHFFDHLSFGSKGEFDHEMMYFPAVVKISENKALLFYSGNYFGRDGMGVMEVLF